MKTIIAGGRDITDSRILHAALDACDWKITEVVCGMARGADTLGKEWAEEFNIPVVEFPADWDKYGKAAGPIRNAEMADYAEALIALWDGKSRGTKNMIDQAIFRKMKVLVYKVIDIP